MTHCFRVDVTVHRNKFLCNKNQLDALISQIDFGMKIYMFRTVPLSILWSLFTVHSAVVYVIKVEPSTRTITSIWEISASSWFLLQRKVCPLLLFCTQHTEYMVVSKLMTLNKHFYLWNIKLLVQKAHIFP